MIDEPQVVPKTDDEDEEDETDAGQSAQVAPIASAPASTAPAPQAAQPHPAPAALDAAFQLAGERYGVEPNLLRALVGTESNYNPNAVSPQGAEGLAQIMPGTARELGVDPRNPYQALYGGAAYLRQGLDRYNGDVTKALMYYHGGPDERLWGPKTHAYPDEVGRRFAALSASAKPIPTDVSGAKAQPIPTDTSGAKAQLAQASPDDVRGLRDEFDSTFNAPGRRQLGPVPQPEPAHSLLDDYNRAFGKSDDLLTRYGGPPPSPGTTSEIAHALSYAGPLIGRVLADQAGFPVDAFNSINDATAKDPNLAIALVDPTSAGIVPLMPTDPNAQSPIPKIPGGSETIRRLVGNIVIAGRGEQPTLSSLITGQKQTDPLSLTASPQELGDTSDAARSFWDVGQGAALLGSLATPGGVMRALGAAREATTALGAAKGVAGALTTTIGKEGAIGAATFGLGDWMAREAVGEGGSPREQAVANVLASALMVARVAMWKGLSTLAHNAGAASDSLRSYLGRTMGPEAVAQRVADNPETAAANLERAAQYGPPSPASASPTLVAGGALKPGEALPAGFKVPATTLSLDEPLQALGYSMAFRDSQLNGDFRKMLETNRDAIMAERPADIGTREDAIAALQSRTAERQQAIEQRIAQATNIADRDAEAALRGAETKPEFGVLQQAMRSVSLHNQLNEAASDIYAMVKADYAKAEAAGVFTTPVQAQPIYDAIRTAARDQAAIGEGGEHFPWQAIKRLYNNDPRAVMSAAPEGKPFYDATGAKRLIVGANPDPLERAFGAPNRVTGALDNVGQLHTLRSDLLDVVRAEKSAWSQPGKVGDSRLIKWANQLADAARQEIERATVAAGNNEALVNANNSFRQWHQTFNSGPLGKITAHDYEGMPEVPPEKVVGMFLASGDNARANLTRLYDALSQMRGAGAGMQHPADTLAQTFQQAIRQEFAGVFHGTLDGGAAAQKWLNNHEILFGPAAPAGYQQMRREFQTAINSAATAQDIAATKPQQLRDLERSRAAAFLGADPGRELDVALRASDKAGAVRDLIADVKADPTGHALNGFRQMAFDKMLTAARVEHPLATENGTYSAAKLRDWWQTTGRTLYTELDKSAPGDLARAERVVNAMGWTDRMLRQPGTVAISKAQQELALTGLGRLMARVLGAAGGRKFAHTFGLGGTIQIPGMGAETGGNIYDFLTMRLPEGRAENVLRDAIMDPAKMKALLQPLTTPEAVSRFHATVEPYLLAAPAVAAQGTLVNPQARTGPETAPPTSGYGLPPDANSLQRPTPTLRGAVPLTSPGNGAAPGVGPQQGAGTLRGQIPLTRP